MVNFLGRTDSKKTHDAESLRQIVVAIRSLLAPAIRLAGDPDDAKSAGAMQAAGIKELEISYFQSVERAMKELTRWGGACETAWNRNLIERSAGPASKPAAKVAARAAAKPAAKPAKKAAKKR